jgi:hypothetical protein
MRGRLLSLLAGIALLSLQVLTGRAQTPGPTPDENPTADTGALKPQIETAGSYDAHSGNVTRVIPDLHFPNAPGVYGLNFTRYYNSLRNDRIEQGPSFEPEQRIDFGAPGWSHSWSWKAFYDAQGPDPIPGSNYDDGLFKTSITITFPDGHASKYKIVRWDARPGLGYPPPYDPRLGPPYTANEVDWPPAGPGVHDRLGGMATYGESFWLYLADGGSVRFVNDATWGYQATEVYDPHGLKTTLHYNNDGNLYLVEQEGGRQLRITWGGFCWVKGCGTDSCVPSVITKVEIGNSGGPALQEVTYGYCWLDKYLSLRTVHYPGADTASYTYESYDPPTGFSFQGPRLVTANDPRFGGPMRFIKYAYLNTGCLPADHPPSDPPGAHFDYYYASPTSVHSESYTASGPEVSSFSLGCFDGTRTEYNGLGGFRMFFFGRSAGSWGNTNQSFGYNLAKLTDYTTTYPLPASLPFEHQNFLDGHPRQIWDGRDIETESVLTSGDSSGLPGEIHHVGSDGSTRIYDRVNPVISEQRDLSRLPGPYNRWLFRFTDERNQTTTYTRDRRMRVVRIDYPGGTYETFRARR